MNLTDNEKMIWAAVFARRFDLSNPPQELCRPSRDAEWRKWEEGQTLDAIERATGAIKYLRAARGSLLKGWGDASAEWEIYKEMVSE